MGHLQANVNRFSGFAECYDGARPQPPAVIVDVLTHMAGVEEPALVVDIGSGTGLSTRIWGGRAREIIGIEPNPDMRAEAERQTPADRDVSYREGTSTQTGLPDECADIVTAVQSLHWMEPEGTFAEAARVLRPCGVFSAIDCDWPPVVHPELDAAYVEMRRHVEELQKATGVYDSVKRWPKTSHLDNMRASGRFSYVRELFAHQVDSGDARRYMGLVHSQGGIVALLKRGCSEPEIGMDRLREVAERVMGGRVIPWYYSYRIRMGIK